MFEYTIDGTTYYVWDDRMYYTLEEEHDLEEIDDHLWHLYDIEGELDDPYPFRLDWGGEIYPRVEVNPADGDGPPKRWVRTEEFSGATPLESVTPDGIQECPDCGSWAGPTDKPPRCFECGYGYEPDEREADA